MKYTIMKHLFPQPKLALFEYLYLIVNFDYSLYQFVMKNIFLQGRLYKKVYMELPEGRDILNIQQQKRFAN